jgi:hypothetical protein
MRNVLSLALVLLAVSIPLVGCDDDTTTPARNKPPVALITSPTEGQSFTEHDSVHFAGSGTDNEDGALAGGSLVWVSDKDGHLGTGTSFGRDDLSVNTHIVTLTTTDSAGDSDSASTTIHVNAAPPVKVLFLGSSYFGYNNLPGMFQNLAESGGQDVIVDKNYINAGYLDDHATSATTAAKINSQQWDFVVLQGVGSIMAFPDTHQNIFPPYVRHELRAALVTLKNKIETNCADTKMVYCMPWAFEDGTTWLPGYNDTYFEMQQMIYDNTLLFSDDVGFVIAPVGWAWNEVLEVKTRLHYLFQPDWNHPSLRGSYLMACVIYSTLFQETTNGNPFYAGVPASEARFFQSVASILVLNNLELWNL